MDPAHQTDNMQDRLYLLNDTALLYLLALWCFDKPQIHIHHFLRVLGDLPPAQRSAWLHLNERGGADDRVE